MRQTGVTSIMKLFSPGEAEAHTGGYKAVKNFNWKR